jgi:hypothetical protein
VRRRSLRARLEERADGRCEYCRAPQGACGYRFHLEHIVPIALGGSDADTNRALACASCNLAKADRIAGQDPVTGQELLLFHPRIHLWHEHFAWSDNHTLIGRTPIGRATIAALDMNSEFRLAARHLWFTAALLP